MNIFKLILNAGKLIKIEHDVVQLINDIKDKKPVSIDVAALITDAELILETQIFAITDEDKAQIKIALNDISEYAVHEKKGA